jgi:hypothetical protein
MDLALLVLVVLAFCGPLILFAGSSRKVRSAGDRPRSGVTSEKTDGDYLRSGAFTVSLVLAWLAYGWAAIFPGLAIISLFFGSGPTALLLATILLPWVAPAGVAVLIWRRPGTGTRIAIPVLAACYMAWLVITFPVLIGAIYFPAGVSLLVGAVLRTAAPPPGGHPGPVEIRHAAASRGVLIL